MFLIKTYRMFHFRMDIRLVKVTVDGTNEKNEIIKKEKDFQVNEILLWL